jgi:peptide/nickel transport system substrate-binding protein/oligopeptide transport system substrate-binding protein
MNTKPSLSRRTFLTVSVLTPLSLLGSLAPLGITPVAQALQGTPTADGGIVIEAHDQPRVSNPVGKQELRLAGTTIDPGPLDPAFARDVNSAFMTRQVFRGLMRFDENLEPVPELAQRVEISPDGLLYRFQLKDDAKFADGTPITAADVVSSFTRALDTKAAAQIGAALAGPSYLGDIVGADALVSGKTSELSGIKAVDDHTVEIQLKAPRATFLMKMASAPAAIVDPRDVAKGGEWWRIPNASGPFVVESWTPDEELRLAANKNYIGGEPDLKHIIFRLGPSASNAFNLYQADEIDVAPVPIYAIDRVADPDSALLPELHVSPILSTEYIAFRDDVAPLDDPQIRRAIQLAFPRAKVADVMLDGRQTVAHGLIPPETLGRTWPASVPDEDLDAARAAIAASRYGSADKVPPIRIYGASPFGSEALRDVLKKDLGLDAEVLEVEWPDFNQRLTQKTFPAYELQWVADFPDPETFLWNLFDSASPDNYSDYNNPAYDKLLDEAAATLDVDQRADLYAQAEALLIQDNVIMPLAHDVSYTLTKPSVHGLNVTPLGILYLESVWLED